MKKITHLLIPIAAIGLVQAISVPFAAGRNELLVSAPGVSMQDPEWSSISSEMVYCASDGQVHVLSINPLTGQILNPRGISDSPLGPCTRGTNGPELGYTESEMLISWTMATESSTALGMATRSLGGEQWQTHYPLPDTEGYRSSYPIQSPSAPAPWLLHAQGSISNTAAWARAGLDPEQNVLVANDTKVPRWIQGSNTVVYVEADGSIIGLDVFSGVRREFLPPSTDARKSPTVWFAPETGKRAISLLNKGVNCLEIYADPADDTPGQRVCGADFGEGFELSSPEPFVVRRRSYLSFRLVDLNSGNNHIYVAGAINLPGESSFIERTSSLAKRKRREPEPFVAQNRAFIYFSGPAGYDTLTGAGVWRTVFNGRP